MSCGTVRIRRDGRSIGRPSRSRPPCPASSPPETPATVRSSGSPPRSEEHTSELQSRLHLVCRLLLEKKKRACEHPGNYRNQPLVPGFTRPESENPRQQPRVRPPVA